MANNFFARDVQGKSYLCAALIFVVPLLSNAETINDKWKVDVTVYAWVPAMHGDVSYPGVAGEKSFDLSKSQVLDSVKMSFMGTFEAKKGKFGVLSDLTYVNLGMSHASSHDFTLGQNAIPVGLNADLAADTQSTLWTTAGTYNLAARGDYSIDVLGGVRLLDITPTLNWQFMGNTNGINRALTGSGSLNLQRWDAVAGLKGQVYLDSDQLWFLPYYVDIGTGQSKLTWQANIGAGYHFKWGSMTATWRHMSYQFNADSAIQNQTISGPVIGASWHW